MAGKFKPRIFGITVLVISVAVVGILGISTFDEGLALQIAPPELRVVGGCFRDCLDPEQTGFGGQDPVVDNGGTIILTDPDDPTNTIEEQILLGDGIMILEDPETGEQVVVIAGTDELADIFPAIECPEGQTFFDPDLTDGVEGMCWGVTFVDSSGQEFETIQVKDTVACWLNVHSDVINSQGDKVGAEQSSFFKTEPVPQLTLVDIPTGAELVGEGGFRLFPMLKCATNTQEGGIITEEAFPDIPIEILYIFPSFDTPLKLEATELVARVYSQSPDGKLIDTFNFKFDVPAQDITDATSRNLGEIFIPAERILVFLPDGQYNSEQQIVIEGQLVLHWNTGIASVDNVPQVIKLQTIQTRDGEGNVLSIVNPLTIFRELDVDRGAGDTPEMPMCQSGQVVINGLCTTIPTGCLADEISINGVCQPLGDGDPTIGKQNFFDRFITCIQSGSQDCLLSTEFVPLYLFGIIGVVAVGVVAQRKEPEVYGVPRGF